MERYSPEVQEAVENIEVDVDPLLAKKLPEYIKENLRVLREVKNKSTESLRKSWLHLDRCLDSLNLDVSFKFQQTNG